MSATNPTSALGVQNWYSDTLAADITASTTTIQLNNLPSPTEGYLIIDPDNTSTREVIHYTSKTSNSVVLPGTGDRGVDGTTAQSHSQGTTIRMDYTSSHFTANQNLYATPSGSVTATLIAPAVVDATKINFGGSGSGVWWQEIARTTLGATAATISSGAFTAKKYLSVTANILSSATIAGFFHFNSDGGNNYSYRLLDDGSASSTTSASGISTFRQTAAGLVFLRADVTNVATQEKAFISTSNDLGPAGAAQGVGQRLAWAKWANTSNQITTIDISTNTSGGFYNPNSELIILGHD